MINQQTVSGKPGQAPSRPDLLVVKRFLDSSTPHREVFTRPQIRHCRRRISTNAPGHHN